MRAVTILGVDPGFASTGWAAFSLTPNPPGVPIEGVLGMGCVGTKPATGKVPVEADRLRRVGLLTTALRDLIDRYRPILVAMEAPSHVHGKGRGPNANTMYAMGLTYGAFGAVCELQRLPVVIYSPQKVKAAAATVATASKSDVQAAMDTRFRMPLATQHLQGVARGKYEHPYDALAVAVTAAGEPLVRTALAYLGGQ